MLSLADLGRRFVLRADQAKAALAAVFVHYLERTGLLLVSPSDRARGASADVLELAAVVLGTIAGYRSFRVAANLGVTSAVVTEVLATGIAATLARSSSSGGSTVRSPP